MGLLFYYTSIFSGISEEERVLERAHRMCENAVLRKGAFLFRLSKFLVAIVESKRNTCSERLRSTAILALSKFMLLRCALIQFHKKENVGLSFFQIQLLRSHVNFGISPAF